MIQRIQTILLLLVAVLMVVTCFSPLIAIADGEKFVSTFYPFGIFRLIEPLSYTWGVIFMAALSALLAFVNIFLYKKRKQQIKICLITALLIVFYYVTTMVYLTTYLNKIPTEYTLSIQFGIIIPVVALILDLLAMNKIKKDEKLVRSLDRIR